MTSDQHSKVTFADILHAANKHYGDGYLSTYFDRTTGRTKRGSGDTLAEFIVRELHQNFEKAGSRKRNLAAAVRVLEQAKRDIQTVIDGLNEL